MARETAREVAKETKEEIEPFFLYLKNRNGEYLAIKHQKLIFMTTPSLWKIERKQQLELVAGYTLHNKVGDDWVQINHGRIYYNISNLETLCDGDTLRVDYMDQNMQLGYSTFMRMFNYVYDNDPNILYCELPSYATVLK